jgi:hypothetical protein
MASLDEKGYKGILVYIHVRIVFILLELFKITFLEYKHFYAKQLKKFFTALFPYFRDSANSK